MNIRIYTITFALILCLRCSDNLYELPSVYNGITQTSESGNIISVDAEDWNFDEYLSVKFDTLLNGDIIPDRDFVYPAYPNPASEYTILKFGLSDAARYTIQVFSATGREEKTFRLKEETSPGIHVIEWNLRNNYGQVMQPGTYRVIVTYYKNDLSVFDCYGDILIK